MMMNRLGVIIDNFESFMNDIYDGCNAIGLSPQKISSYLADLMEFSKTTPFSKISEFIRQKIEEKKGLEQEIERLNDQTKKLKEEKSVSENHLNSALHNEIISTVELNSYSDLKKELLQYGLSIKTDLARFVRTVKEIIQKGYDAKKVIKVFSDLDSAKDEYLSYQASIPDLKMKYDKLSQERSILEETMDYYNQRLILYDELQKMRFGRKELKQLYNTFNEIALANNISQDRAHQKFFKDIEEDYDEKLGFELKLSELRSEISTTSANLNFLRTASFAQPLVGLSLQKLLSKGLNEVDIVELADILFEGFPDNNSSISTGNKDTNKQSLIVDLKKYGSINSVLQELVQQANRLRGQIDELQKQKQHLGVQNQMMLYTIANSEPIIKFLHGSNDSFNIDKENVKILAVIVFILNILYVRHSPTEELLDNDLVKLTGQMSRNIVVEDEQTLLIPQLKTVIIKSLNILIAKLSNNDSDQQTDIVPD
jgi:predicted acetyltransferase